MAPWMSSSQEGPDGWRYRGGSSGRRAGLFVLGLVACGLVVTLATIAWPARGSPRREAQATPATATPAATARTPALAGSALACRRGEETLRLLGALAREGRWAAAGDAARAALQRDDLCPIDRQALTAQRLRADLELLLATTAAPTDRRGQEQGLATYRELAAEAEARTVTLPGRRELVERAYGQGQFVLARALFEESWAAGELGREDRASIRMYASTLFNLGYWWTEASGPDYGDGLLLLATAAAVDASYGIGSGAAAERLGRLLGPDPASWPAPVSTPLLP